VAHLNRKPRILHVIDNTDPGAAQSQMAAIFQGLYEQLDFSVAVLGRPGRVEVAYLSLGIPVYALQSGRSRWNMGSFLPLLRLIRRLHPDLVHAHLFKSLVLSSLAARLMGIPCLLHDHSGLEPQSLKFYFPKAFSRALYSLAYKYAVRSSARILVLTQNIHSTYIEQYDTSPAKLTILPNAIDLEKLRSLEPNGPCLREELDLPASVRLVVMVGRLAPEKDWPTYIDIASRFPDPSQHAFVAVGSGRLEGQLRRLASDRGLENIHFLGDRQDVAYILQQADAFVLTSRWESFGIVLLEAMAAGSPVISSRTTGSSAIIQPEVSGLLVNVGDVDGFVSSLNRVLSDPALASRFVSAARLSLTQYDIKVVCQQLLEIYTALIHPRETWLHD